ncbi:MAG: F0F1 ATP synthase subunit A [Candidatus Kapabacteria bacterium]|nr:F0F1 ATP synthase subunit A [Candidatus Kapabacteria bacterium]
MNNPDTQSSNTHHSSESTQAPIDHSHSGKYEGSHDVPREQVFSHLLRELGDHHGFVLFDHIADLPIIILDSGNLYTYSSPVSMEQAGIFTMYKGHPVRKADMKPPQLDLSVTNYVVFQWIAFAVLTAIGLFVAGKYKKNPKQAPRGIQNIMESVIIYLRDEVVYANIKGAAAQRLLPYFITLFFSILLMNLFGLIPGLHTATGAIGVTAGLAITAFIVINYTAIRESGIGAWLAHLTGGVPARMWPMWLIMVPIEFMGMFIKPFVLTMRLFANMTAGHIILLAFVGLIFFFKSIFIAPASTAFSVFIYFLELLAAFLQAYIFTMLTAVFTGMAIGDHAHDAAHAAQH